MAKYYRANNKRGYLNARVTPTDIQLELQVIDYGGGAKDRNIPTIAGKFMRLVIWGVQYPSPSADLDREIVSATWTGSGRVFDIVRAQEGTEAHDHYIGDNIALLFTADMSREVLIFEDFEESIAGSIAYTDDTDEDEEMEVIALPPDNEVSEEGYRKILVSGGVGKPPYWQFAFATEVGATKAIIPPPFLLAVGLINEYIGAIFRENGEVFASLTSDWSSYSCVWHNRNAYVIEGNILAKRNLYGVRDTSFG